MSAGLNVSGIAELRKALRAAQDIDNLAEFRNGLKAAADIVAQEAKSHVPSRTGRAADTIRATASGNKAYVQGGTSSVRYYGWLDFGTRRPVRGNPRSKGPWSGSGKGPVKGRFIYPAFDAKQEQVRKAVENGVETMNKKVGLI